MSSLNRYKTMLFAAGFLAFAALSGPVLSQPVTSSVHGNLPYRLFTRPSSTIGLWQWQNSFTQSSGLRQQSPSMEATYQTVSVIRSFEPINWLEHLFMVIYDAVCQFINYICSLLNHAIKRWHPEK